MQDTVKQSVGPQSDQDELTTVGMHAAARPSSPVTRAGAKVGHLTQPYSAAVLSACKQTVVDCPLPSAGMWTDSRHSRHPQADTSSLLAYHAFLAG